MSIQTIIKKAIKRLELEGKLLTPDFYNDAFCKEAKKAGMDVQDCNQLETFTKTLNKEFQKELSTYRIKTMNEFVRFIVAKLNRTNPSKCSEIVESQTIFIKRVLQVVEVLHNKEAALLAKKSIDILQTQPTATQIDQYRQLWVNFITTYDDTFLQKLKQVGDVNAEDLAETILNLDFSNLSMCTHSNNADLSKISALLVASLVPSIASSVNEDIAKLSDRIKNQPSLLESQSMESEIRSAISLRIALDKDTLKTMLKSLDGVLDKLSLKLINMIERSDSSNSEIQKIKGELELYNEASVSNFKITHKKLFTIACALEESTQGLSSDLKTHNTEVLSLTEKVHKLERELATAKEESKEDFLTKLYNKRALDEFLHIKEAEYERYGRNFSIVMFDLDHFKDVNDNYGHDAGDAVLVAFAKILKKEARTVDIVGRFGGEEFLALLSDTDTKGGVVFAEKVRKHVQKARFMYKGKRIKLTVSCGVSERKKHPSFQHVINSADEYLYKAKKDGRDRVAYN